MVVNAVSSILKCVSRAFFACFSYFTCQDMCRFGMSPHFFYFISVFFSEVLLKKWKSNIENSIKKSIFFTFQVKPIVIKKILGETDNYKEIENNINEYCKLILDFSIAAVSLSFLNPQRRFINYVIAETYKDSPSSFISLRDDEIEE